MANTRYAAIIIEAKLPSWNELIGLCKKHYTKYNEVKRYWKDLVFYSAKGIKSIKDFPIALRVIIGVENKSRHDLDNYAIKLLTDGLVAAKIIPDDNLKYIAKIIVEFEYSPVSFVNILLESLD